MTARDLLHHVFPWEVTTGVERVDGDEPAGAQIPETATDAGR